MATALTLHERALVDYARRLLGGDLDRARDVVQEVFLRLCRQRTDAIEGHLKEWLFTVTRNLVLDVRRKESRMTEMTREHGALLGASPDPAARRLEVREEVDGVLARLVELPPKQREALRLRFQHGLSYRDVGRVMDESIGNVGWLIHAGIRGLRGKLVSRELDAKGVEA